MGAQSEAFTAGGQLPLHYGTLSLEIEVADPEMLTEILRQPAESRDRYIKEALRLGILAMRMANGHVDASSVRQAGERLIGELRETLNSRGDEMTSQMGLALTRYFDPESGVLQQRLRSLVERDGELERLMRSHVEGDDSALARTLSSHLGEQSPIFRLLSPEDAGGLRAVLEKTMEETLTTQREAILSEFSLDKKESALRRLVEELEGQGAELQSDLKGKVDAVIGEFSLDKEDSALSRLVGRVEKAQRTITDEFSLDRDGSALSRMAKMIVDFQSEVREALAAIGAQKAEAKRATRHGFDFEDALGIALGEHAQRLGDIHQATGNTTGTIKNCKVGDHVVTLGPDSPAPGAKLVFESKQAQGYDLTKCLAEIERGRKNRGGQVGVFVFSASSAPAGMDAFSRYGNDLVVVWDAEDPGTDVVLHAAVTTARALALRVREVSTEADEATKAIERSTRTIEKQLKYLVDIQKMAETTRASGEKIGDRARRMRDDLACEIEEIDLSLAALKIIE